VRLRAHGERGHPTPAGAIGTVVEFAGPGWALVRWDRGGQALTHPSDLTLDDSPPAGSTWTPRLSGMEVAQPTNLGAVRVSSPADREER
jgi:hypothetical protein